MTIRPGDRFGVYDVAEPIGFGGMGEVYRAVDVRLGRDVAIKVLPPSFADDATRVARFELEAKTLASLNHANIAQIYGLERGDGSIGIVMELVDGETLAERLLAGRIAVDEALRICGQIADALEAAHTRAIVHRDLKPANIKVKPDGTVKVLDFGIAKAFDPRLSSGPGPAALTTPAMTAAGIVLGTAAYMSPEQARGKPVDQRTDIWAFGCVLYEMLAGKHAFIGEDVTSTLARVLESRPDFAALPANVPRAVRRTLELCLEKDPHKRIADMRDVKLALAGAFDAGGQEPPRRRSPSLAAAAVVAAAVLAGAAAWLLKPEAVSERKAVTRFEYALPRGVDFRDTMTSVLGISPAGDAFAFNGTGGIYVRRMDGTETRLLPGTAPLASDSVAPDVVFSPDGREIAFFRGPPGKLLRTAIDGGTPIVVADVAPAYPFGLSWEPDGTLYYGQLDGIWRVSQNGGTPEQLVKTEAPEQVYGPRLLPGGEWLLFTRATAPIGPDRWEGAEIVIQSLASGERRVLRSGGFDARYLPTGHITYVSQNVLFASTFDVGTLTLGSERVPLVQDVRAATPAAGGSGFYAVANNGTLAFAPVTAAPAPRSRPRRQLVWVDRAGEVTPLPLRPDDYTNARVSPDGTKIAIVVGSVLPRSDPPPDIYVFDIETESLAQLTFNPASDDGPMWSRDSSRIFYRAWDEKAEAAAVISSLPADGGTPEFVARSGTTFNPLPWSLSPDGRTLLVVDAETLEDVNLGSVRLGENTAVEMLLDGAGLLSEPSLAPNGRWLVYHERNSSGNEISIRPYPDVQQQRRLVGPGLAPVLSADGSELFFFDGNGLSVVPVQYAPFRVGNVRELFRGRYWYGVGGADGGLGRAWDVDSTKDRFLMITVPEEAAPETPEPSRIHFVLNWFEELERRLPQR